APPTLSPGEGRPAGTACKQRHPEGEPGEREGSGRADLACPQILWVARAPRRMTLRSRSLHPRTARVGTLSLVSPLPAGGWGELGEGPGVRAPFRRRAFR